MFKKKFDWQFYKDHVLPDWIMWLFIIMISMTFSAGLYKSVGLGLITSIALGTIIATVIVNTFAYLIAYVFDH